MDPLLQRLVDARRVGHKLPALVFWLPSLSVIGYIAPDRHMVDDTSEYFAEMGFPELAEQVGLADHEPDARYITLAKVKLIVTPNQDVDLPFLRLDTELITSWSVRGPLVDRDGDS